MKYCVILQQKKTIVLVKLGYCYSQDYFYSLRPFFIDKVLKCHVHSQMEQCLYFWSVCRVWVKVLIVYTVYDFQGFNDVGFHGSTQIPTPNIDALAYSGLILNNYYVQPICTPSRSALMTGKHPIHTGKIHSILLVSCMAQKNVYCRCCCTICGCLCREAKFFFHCTFKGEEIFIGHLFLGLNHDVIYGPQPYGLPLGEQLLSQYLLRLGYTTRHVGKWHLGMAIRELTPTHRGFMSHLGYWGGHQDYYDHTVFLAVRLPFT